MKYHRILWLALLLMFVHVQVLGQNTPTGLGNTSWQLVKFQGGDDKTLMPDDKAKYTIAFGEDGGVSVRIDCNRGRGTWKSSEPSQLEFGPLALTRAMCPPAPLNDRIPKDWQYVRSYTMKDGHLFLALMADGGIYEFEPKSSEENAASTESSQTTPSRSPCDERQASQSQMNDCAAYEQKQVESRLHKVYQKAIENMTADQARAEKEGDQRQIEYEKTAIAALLQAERAWLTYRDVQCKAAGQQYEGGSIRPLIQSQCLTTLTEHRIADLKSVYENGDRKLE
jgi:uncharacterized protein YecT (DUF1311 family)/heat shock protein HslJ